MEGSADGGEMGGVSAGDALSSPMSEVLGRDLIPSLEDDLVVTPRTVIPVDSSEGIPRESRIVEKDGLPATPQVEAVP